MHALWEESSRKSFGLGLVFNNAVINSVSVASHKNLSSQKFFLDK